MDHSHLQLGTNQVKMGTNQRQCPTEESQQTLVLKIAWNVENAQAAEHIQQEYKPGNHTIQASLA